MEKKIHKLFNFWRKNILTDSQLEKAILKLVEKRSIDNVTTTYLAQAMSLSGINVSYEDVDHIIDLVELLENKGGKTSFKDITKLKVEWNKK